ncbi:MAG TPA: transferrin receptor-like dimerization domain-containing protein [Terriglobia bacterium]|nr:transferrin receptor-like dimerization domain-containing protein [Terriglobia bacterium]
MKKLPLCRVLCGKARPFRPIRRKEKKNKLLRLGWFPESQRLSAQHAAKPHQAIRLSRLIFLAVFALAALGADEPQNRGLAGYSADGARVEREWEMKFRALPSPDNMREYMKRLSARPHHVGSPYDQDNAQWILSKFKEWGLDAHIETFHVLFPTPKERLVELVEPTKFVAKLKEPAFSVDPTSDQMDEQLPTYNAYSTDGDVTGPLVYVNYGVPEDYKQLERLGLSVKGAIVIARYGASWRGIKPKVAAEHGAVGCLIYSDPRDDGYFQGDVFPQGPWRPLEGAQRGSVMDMTLYSGDPLTPGVGATEEAKRLPVGEAPTITKVPVMPLSYGDAQPLLAALQGPVAPDGWRGALPLPYHIGPGPAKVHLRVSFNWDIKPIYDVIARVTGSQYPAEWIIRGNHHDAWVNGAQDPISGQMALLEEARGFADLLKEGWKPRRTIIYCAWDGEEEGLLGSTEWAEQHADELQANAAVYINTDSNGRGYLNAGGSHTLEQFINGVERDIEDPETRLSVWKRNQLARIKKAAPDDLQEVRQRPDLRIGALGSGSDYTGFLQHLGIAALNLSYDGEDGGGIYHSVYDDFYWYTHFSDTQFVYGRALAQTVGTSVMRLADAGLLPLDFTNFADTVRKYVEELRTLLKKEQDETRERNKQIEEGVFAATADPRQVSIPPKMEEVPPYLNFAPLDNAVSSLSQGAGRYAKALAKARENGGSTLDRAALDSVDKRLIESERRLTTREGLPRRPWYRHQIYAPGYYTGYGVKTIPAVREAIEEKQWKEADEQIVVVAKVLNDEAALIDSAAAELDKATAAAHQMPRP